MNARMPPILARALAPLAPPQSEVHRIVADSRTLADKAMEFTLLVERYMRDDTGMPTVNESDVASALYCLRSAIAQEQAYLADSALNRNKTERRDEEALRFQASVPAFLRNGV